jgi:Family of unknown function (DUF5985)
MFLFLSGMLMMGCLVIATFLWRFWLRTGDRFFVLFSLAWVLLGAERLGLAIRNTPEEPRAGMYFLRLAAFLLIIVAILYKNRAPSR